MKQVLVILPILCLSACATTGQVGAPIRSGFTQTQSAASDALGLARERPGMITIEEGDDTVPTPYGGEGARRRCSTTARDIARLTAILGADREAPPPPPSEEPEDDRSLVDKGRDFASDAPEMAGDAARDAYHSTIVGLNPARPIIRFIGRAGEIEAEARRERELALKRRAYLRGLFDGYGCERDVLVEAFETYGLTQGEHTPET
ncbi:hypothetical protein [Woodsholea maritima]|uniref:hypothetical protein n=1 Tax=Woodsholea maritima TaxID=240237 RepID=UPI0003779612|nr:hypothetical protein [Woodsholea maritima]